MEAFSDGCAGYRNHVARAQSCGPVTPARRLTSSSVAGHHISVTSFSFLTIGGAWIAHNGLTDDLDRVDSIFLRLNLLFLLAVSFLPFPTRLVAEALDKSTASQRGCTA